MTTPNSGALRLDRVSVSFPIYQGASRSLKKSLMYRTVGGQIGRHADRITVRALEEISFSLQQGDRLALFGVNGAGKTTLLRVMAGVYEPTAGLVSVSGRISSMLDLGICSNSPRPRTQWLRKYSITRAVAADTAPGT